MTVLTEGMHAGEFLVSEANGSRSREAVTVLSGENLQAGHVIARVTKAGTASAEADAGNTGDGAMGAITVGSGAKPGDYRLTIIEPGTDLGTFIVEDPDGINIGSGVVGSAFSAGGLGFTLADGSADFVAGDAFTITVDAGGGEVVEYDPAGTDGSEFAAGLLFDAVDASDDDRPGVIIARDAEYNAGEIVYKSGLTTDQKAEARRQLALLGIIAR